MCRGRRSSASMTKRLEEDIVPHAQDLFAVFNLGAGGLEYEPRREHPVEGRRDARWLTQHRYLLG